MKLKLYHYWRSSASWRVRWAMAYKGVHCEFIPVDLLIGEEESKEHLARNPFGTVPALEILEAGAKPRYLIESIAIIEWLEEVFPQPRLLPGSAWQRARIRQLVEVINSGIHPYQNLSTLLVLSEDAQKRKEWSQYWIRRGFNALEALLADTAGSLCLGDTLTLADLCLIPQCYNARRNQIELDEFPRISRIWTTAMALPSCESSLPERFQPPSAG